MLLRPVEQRDAAAITAALQDWEVTRWLSSVPWPYAREDAEWFIAEAEAGRVAPLAIMRDDALLGIIATDDELGYWLARAHWGQGYMPEAAAAVVDAFFESRGENLASSHLEGNARSAAVLSGLGFREMRRQMRPSRPLGREVASVVVELTRADWQARRSGT
ncbi:GNAT family N-acetyltransferase [Histidinibacterium lentulum]|uniref:GNAT family N-acetyltransferase n=1 Tax=Histidinibacterium lentulum TaxID=2480588 RepID=UPI00160D14C0|nr:GNAT family N-acetyltransferase [Histidinibacterium lentulum]